MCVLWFVLAMQCATFILLLALVLNVAPIVPDIIKVIKVVDTTLYDVKFMLPQLNASLWDLNHVLPGIKKTIFYTEAICEHTKGCWTY
ncbi:MAG: hypothetical protein CMM25_04020 [Rhodospirillaceae bacterium]|nr:hypothetical protein [Rhodospirillaceae bacterium]